MRNRGFTLIELLVAMAIVAVIGVLALGGLITLIQQEEIAKRQAERMRELQFAVRMITQDLSQIHPRPVRDDLGYKAAVVSDPRSEFALEFSRGGWTNPGDLPRGTIQRVAYFLEDGALIRVHWPNTDRTLATVPARNELLADVEAIELRFLDRGGQWHNTWPVLGLDPQTALGLAPRAVEFGLVLEDYDQILRLIEVGG